MAQPNGARPAGPFPLRNSAALVHYDVDLGNAFMKLPFAKYIGPNGDIVGITATDLTLFLNENPHRNDFMIIDLREIADVGTANTQQILGARHLPLTQNSQMTNLVQYKSLEPLSANSAEATAKAKTLWDAMVAKPTLPIAEAQTKDYVFFHCHQSQNRTPSVASGYLEFAARPGQQVIIIEGGWLGYAQSQGRRVEPYAGEPPLANFSLFGSVDKFGPKF